MRRTLATIVSAALILAAAGCGKSERNTGLEQGRAPVGPVSYADGKVIASYLARSLNGGTYGSVSNTGSMEPLIDSSVIPIYLPADGSQLRVGQVVVYTSQSGRQILHRVADLNSTHFIPEGIANARFDGWVPRSAVNRVVLGMIYTEGQP